MTILDLNVDVLLLIFDCLIQRDIKALRLVCKAFESHAKLRFLRLFLSPSRTNIEVFHNVVSHHVFRLQVQEIVWDDARFKDYETRGFSDEKFFKDARVMTEQIENNGTGSMACPAIDIRRKELWGDASHTKMSLEDCFKIYCELYEEQQRIIASGEDVEALRRGLQYLPNLKRVTLTSEAWRLHPLFPVYETPFWRSLPPGFVMAPPWPWVGETNPGMVDSIDENLVTRPWTEPHEEWRGYSIVVSELLGNAARHQVSEFVVDVHRERTGISQRLFTSQNTDYLNTAQLFNMIKLTRLDLALNLKDIRCADGDDDDIFTNVDSAFWTKPLLKQALSKLNCLKHFHLQLTTFIYTEWMTEPLFFTAIPWLSLRDILPYPYEEAWPSLEHFGLGNVCTTENGLHEVLSTLPNLQVIDLDSLILKVENKACELISTASFLERIKRSLVEPESGIWNARRPRWAVHMICAYPDFVRLTIDNDQIHHFLYENGTNPFDPPHPGRASDNILPWKVHDFDETPPVRNRYYTVDELSMQRAKRFNSLLYYPSKEEDAEKYYATDGKGNMILKSRSWNLC
jgi:hypothetical protein